MTTATTWRVFVTRVRKDAGRFEAAPDFPSFTAAWEFFNMAQYMEGVASLYLCVIDGHGNAVQLQEWEKEDVAVAIQTLADQLVGFAKEASAKDPIWDGQRITPADPVEL